MPRKEAKRTFERSCQLSANLLLTSTSIACVDAHRINETVHDTIGLVIEPCVIGLMPGLAEEVRPGDSVCQARNRRIKERPLEQDWTLKRCHERACAPAGVW